jgi:hypothetical protein
MVFEGVMLASERLPGARARSLCSSLEAIRRGLRRAENVNGTLIGIGGHTGAVEALVSKWW